MGRKVLEMGGNVVFGFRESIDVEDYTKTITIRGIGTAALFVDPEDGDIPPNSPSSPTGSVDILTLTELPTGCILGIGGVVSARSVKLISEELQLQTHNSDVNVRDNWLQELREDIRSHARLMNCGAVLNYREEICIQNDIYVLSAEATACRLDFEPLLPKQESSSAEEEEEEAGEEFPSKQIIPKRRVCCSAHVPFRRQKAPFAVDLTLCRLCHRRYVPDMILATIEPPRELETAGETVLVEAFVVKPIKKRRENEVIAAAISSSLPFVEYDIHRQLLYKLRLRGYNAIFGLKYHLAVSSTSIVAVASGTAVLLLGLPPPEPLRINRYLEVKDEEDRWMVELQRKLVVDAEQNNQKVEALLETFSHLLIIDRTESDDSASLSDTESDTDSNSSASETDSDRQKLSVVQIDDETDEDLILVLLEPTFESEATFLVGNLEGPPPVDLNLDDVNCSTKFVPQLVTIFRRIRILPDGRHLPYQLAQVFHSMYKEAWIQARIAFQNGKLSLRSVRHNVSLTREGELQIFLQATIFGEMSQPSAAEEHGRQEREEEWEELISLDVSTSSDESDADEHRLFSRRRRKSLDDDSSSTESSEDEAELLRNTVTSPGGKIQKFIIAGHMNHVDLTCASSIPASVTIKHHGSISLKLFKEIHLSEVPGGSSLAFCQDLLLEAMAILRAHVIALGGNALVNLQLKPAAFLENFKNQLHGILHISGDVLELELDEPDAWSMLAHKAFYPSDPLVVK